MAFIIFRVIAIIALAVAIYGWVQTRGKIDGLEKEVAEAEASLEQAETRSEELDLEINMMNNKVSNIQSELSDAEKRTQKLKTQSSQRSLEIKNLKEEISLAQTENEKLNQQNKKLRQEIGSSINIAGDKYREEIEVLNTTINSLELKVETLQQKNRDLEDKVADLSNRADPSSESETDSTDLNTLYDFGITSTRGITKPVTTGQTASILKVDHRNSLVILDLSADEGYEKDMEISLLKGFDKPVRIRIQSAQNNFSIASILPGGSAKFFNTGDTVEIVQ